MGFPTLLINSATGSDANASGAGPATALVGSAGVTAADGLSVILDGSPDLSGVLTDGTHALFMADTNAGSRNFSKITGTANSGTPTATVTVADAFQALNTDAWAIGGKRASIGSTTSAKLFSNNSAAGDMMPGWICEMQSGHAETIAATYTLRRAGDVTDGIIVLRGTPGAATRPIVTFSNNGNGFNFGTSISGLELSGFEIQNSNVTKSLSVAIANGSSTNNGIRIKNIKIAASGASQYWKAFTSSGAGQIVEDCECGNCASNAVSTSVGPLTVRNCYIYSNGGNGVTLTGTTGGSLIEDNVFASNTGDDISDARTPTTNLLTPLIVRRNVLYNSSGDGIECTVTSAQTSLFAAVIENNIFSEITGSGINLSGTGGNDIQCAAHGARIRNNCFYNCGAKYAGMTILSSIDESTLDPQFVNAGAGNFAIGTNLKALGYPLVNVGVGSSTRSYVDIGPQRQEAGGGGGAPIIGLGSPIIRAA